MAEQRSKPDQYQLRFPPGMRDRLKTAADRRGRSMNAEIIDRLEQSFKGWPRINLPDDLFERVKNARLDQRAEMEKEITASAIDTVNRVLPAAGSLHTQLVNTFHRLMNKVPQGQRDELDAEFSKLWLKLAAAATDKKPE